MGKRRRSESDTFINATMGDYQLRELLAVGGMSRVYVGYDVRLERRAAVKVLELDQDWVDNTIIERFEREAKSVAALEHNNIITIYQSGEYDGAYFLAMQYIDGRDMRKELRAYRQRDERMPVARGLKLMRQVASALDHAHLAGIIHRDIKPSNILLTNDDKAILTDFGLVLRPDVDNTLGTAFGTPRYIAPEQAIASQQANAQSDIYSFAVIMYEILTGNTPFDGETPMEIALAHVSDTPEAPSKRVPELPKAVDAVILKALNKEPADRHETAIAFMDELDAAFAGVAKGDPDAPPLVPPISEQDAWADAPVDVSLSAATQSHGHAPAVSVPSPLQPEPTPAPAAPAAPSYSPEKAPTGGGSRTPLLIGLLVLILAAAGGYFFFFQGGSSGDGLEIVLLYDEATFVIQNAGDETMSGTRDLEFVRGTPSAGGDDFNGDRIPGDSVSAGNCHRIGEQNRDLLNPPDCRAIESQELLNNPDLFWWRTEPNNQTSFEVRWEGRVLARCDTIRRGDAGECRFRYPLPTEDDT